MANLTQLSVTKGIFDLRLEYYIIACSLFDIFCSFHSTIIYKITRYIFANQSFRHGQCYVAPSIIKESDH